MTCLRPRGSPQLTQAIAGWLNHTFLAGMDVTPDDLFISNGVTSLLNTIFLPLADAGDGVLIPAPYYPAFDMDLMVESWNEWWSAGLFQQWCT